ncbi:cytochrome d ubiquinol oxidase subunit II [Thiomicrorhabdus sp.]|uniref:cytochrome d ubiquinol oxidase subunit II n=1 Tax=Thiomicrorhabdus sp. TaxID=2039724 RepID=UPI002AA86BA2|nr:cytochrome d ubiquinol oxidase subunit II [Thiomicrorhabdus sp.]
MDLINAWAAILIFSIFMYVVLDGFDLGVGIIFPFFADSSQRDVMINSIAPVWDGNETWLIFTGVCLLAIFPKAYSILLPALYIPVIAMLLGLVFRGVAFEFREAGGAWKLRWDILFHIGSVVVAFSQGIILGSVIQGTTIFNGQFAGYWLDWLSPFTLFTGLAVVIGYALMGASWLVMKTTDGMQQKARTISAFAITITFVALIIISLWTTDLNQYYFDKWFNWPGYWFTLLIPLMSIIATTWFIYGLYKQSQFTQKQATEKQVTAKHQSTPFLASIALFASGYIGVLYNLYPYILPPNLTFKAAAAPDSSLHFLIIGTLVMLPIVVSYFVYSHYVFRGKVKPKELDY